MEAHGDGISLSRRSFLGASLGSALALSPLGALLARDETAGYKLPFPGGVVWLVGQGVNSGGTHSGRAAYAWDFRMSEGSPIIASRGGVVVMVKDDSSSNCRWNIYSCPEWNNYIVVDHSDGSAAAYLHGLHGGARVRVGQVISQGELLCLSGNTGQSGGPHLHFQVQSTEPGRYLAQSFPIAFDDVPSHNGVPVRRESYRSGNTRLADFDIRDGHFYTQTNGSDSGLGTGFSVTDDGGVPMWSTLLGGGPERVGFPVSRRFRIDGVDSVYQVFQRQLFEWPLGEKRMRAITIPEVRGPLDEAWLATQTALPLGRDFSESDRRWDHFARAQLAFLDSQPRIKDAYWSVADPIGRYGLPLGPATETERALILKTRRASFQIAKRDSPFAKAGDLIVSTAADLSLDAEPFSRQVLEPDPLFPQEKMSFVEPGPPPG